MTVNGQTFNGVMPPLGHLTDHEIADVLTYVRNSWGNRGGMVEDAQVAAQREALRQPAPTGHP
jgi:nitrite reductase (NO-forming)